MAKNPHQKESPQKYTTGGVCSWTMSDLSFLGQCQITHLDSVTILFCDQFWTSHFGRIVAVCDYPNPTVMCCHLSTVQIFKIYKCLVVLFIVADRKRNSILLSRMWVQATIGPVETLFSESHVTQDC